MGRDRLGSRTSGFGRFLKIGGRCAESARRGSSTGDEGRYAAAVADDDLTPAQNLASWAMAGATLLLVVGIVFGGWWLLERDKVAHAGVSPTSQGETIDRPAELAEDQDYYAHVRLVEVRDDNDGSSWDAGGGAPDLVVTTFWNGTEVHASAHRDDSLTAEWDLLRVNVKDAVLQNEIDVAGAINAPLVQGGPGNLLSVEVWDDDDASFSDLAARLDLPTDLLVEGINRFAFDEGNLVRLEIDLVPARLTLPELIDRYSNR